MFQMQQPGQTAARMFAANERMNQILLEHLDPSAWRAKPPGKVRTIAAIFTHMHNVRTKWIRLTAPHLKVPRQLNRTHCDTRASAYGIGRERRSLRGDAGGGARRRRTNRDVSQRRLGAAVAGWHGDAVLHACPRSAPSRAGVHACASAWIFAAERGGLRAMELGEVVEGIGLAGWPGSLHKL